MWLTKAHTSQEAPTSISESGSHKLTKKQQKNHIESGNNLDEVIKQILEYNCELVAFYDNTQEVE